MAEQHFCTLRNQLLAVSSLDDPIWEHWVALKQSVAKHRSFMSHSNTEGPVEEYDCVTNSLSNSGNKTTLPKIPSQNKFELRTPPSSRRRNGGLLPNSPCISRQPTFNSLSDFKIARLVSALAGQVKAMDPECFPEFIKIMEEALLNKKRKWKTHSFSSCFIGQDAVTWMTEYLSCTRISAVKIANCLCEKGYIFFVTPDNVFRDQLIFYRFTPKNCTISIDNTTLDGFFEMLIDRNSKKNLLLSDVIAFGTKISRAFQKEREKTVQTVETSKQSKYAKKGTNEESSELVVHLERFLRIVLSLKTSKTDASTDISIPSLFHRAMCFRYENNISEPNIYNASMNHLQILLRDFLPNALAVLSTDVIAVAYELAEFCYHYRVDMFSCLVGHPVGKNIMPYLTNNHIDENCRGMLAVCKETRDSRPIYVRLCYRQDEHVYLRTDAVEESTSVIHYNSVFVLPRVVVEYICVTPVHKLEGLEEFVDNSIKHLFSKIFEISEIFVRDFFVNNGHCDKSVFVYVPNNPRGLGIAKIPVYQHCVELCSSMLEEMPKVVVDKIRYTSEQETDLYLANTDIKNLFVPTLLTNLAELACVTDITCKKVFRNTLHRFTSCLEELNALKSSILDGSRKSDLSSWWLIEIQEKTDELLDVNGFRRDAISSNYLDEPPEDIELVKKNLEIIRELITKGDKFKRVIDDLRALIYPRIEEFVEDSITLLLLDYDVESFEKLSEIADEISATFPKTVQDTIKDIHYLKEMIALEDPIYANGKKNLHIVPLSGLALSRLIRAENEQKTVLELWDTAKARLLRSVVTPVSQPKSGILYVMLKDKQIKNAEAFVESWKNEIEEEDINKLHLPYGTTVFHLSLSLGLYKVASKLMKISSLNINVLASSENNALHFIGSKRVESDKEIELQCKLAKRLLSLGCGIYKKNKCGETPLHCACHNRNVKLSKVLLEAKADPNAKTKLEETPLHSCVYICSTDPQSATALASSLLAHRADPFQQTRSQMNALSLARHSKCLPIIKCIGESLNPRE